MLIPLQKQRGRIQSILLEMSSLNVPEISSANVFAGGDIMLGSDFYKGTFMSPSSSVYPCFFDVVVGAFIFLGDLTNISRSIPTPQMLVIIM